MAETEPTNEPSGAGRVYFDSGRPLSELTDAELRKLAGALIDSVRPGSAERHL